MKPLPTILRAAKRLPVDVVEMTALFDQSRAGPVRAFFDRASTELESMPRDAEVEGVFDDILAEPARWMEILLLPLAERRALRRRFVDEQMTTHTFACAWSRRSMGSARSPGWTRSCANAASGRISWLAFRAQSLAPLARAWLSALDIEPMEGGGQDLR